MFRLHKDRTSECIERKESLCCKLQYFIICSSLLNMTSFAVSIGRYKLERACHFTNILFVVHVDFCR